MRKPTPLTYKTTNWPSYDEALKRRGSLTIWFDPATRREGAPTGKRGRPRSYGAAAIQNCLTLKVLFGMALRQTTGFMESLLRLIGRDWSVPDISALCRRRHTLAVRAIDRPSRRLNGDVRLQPSRDHGRYCVIFRPLPYTSSMPMITPP